LNGITYLSGRARNPSLFYFSAMIDHYSFGKITIDGKVYTFDCIILHDPAAPGAQQTRVIENWWRESGHRLCVKDIAHMLSFAPECIIIGQGAYSAMKVSDEAREAIESMGIERIFQDTEKACKTVNRLFGIKKFAAGFHLTC